MPMISPMTAPNSTSASMMIASNINNRGENAAGVPYPEMKSLVKAETLLTATWQLKING